MHIRISGARIASWEKIFLAFLSSAASSPALSSVLPMLVCNAMLISPFPTSFYTSGPFFATGK
jgi:hypothetical protein